ncbi:MAG: PEP-CTERM sorting domain-containing protein [Pseudomonadota bacterium]
MVKLKIASSIAALMLIGANATPAIAVPIMGPGGNHYDFIREEISFNDALTASAAATFTFRGQVVTGHLATITRRVENDFIFDALGSGFDPWIAGSDRDEEGVWKWVAGPEAGETFWIGGVDGSTPAPGVFVDWATGEPSNTSNEDALHITNNLTGGSWNDARVNTLGLPTGYVIEFETAGISSIPLPATLPMLIAGLAGLGIALRRRTS